MLQSLAGKLNRSNDVREIGMSIANELRQLIDYHNCRVFIREGQELLPIAFQGELTAPDRTAAQVFRTRVGEGLTGHVVVTGDPLLLDDASACEFAVEIPGTAKIEESIIAVPLHYGSRVTGAIVVSKLGLSQFDEDDLRLLQVLAGHAAVALENARLYEAQRREAESAKALLEFGRDLAAAEGLERVLERVVEGAAQLLSAPHAALWLQDSATGDVVVRAAVGGTRSIVGDRVERGTLTERVEPFVLSEPPSVVAPFVVEGRWGAIAVASHPDVEYGGRELDLLGGLGAPGQARDRERVQLRGPRAHLPLDGRGARERPRGTRRVHVLPRPLDHRHGPARRPGARPRRRDAEAARARRALPRHRQDRDPELDPAQAGPLTEEERELIETHPELGAKIIAPIDQLQDVCGIVRACHERWDGGGYPDRKAGDEIPLEARIIFACDAFHAMTTDRPYRIALDPAGGAPPARGRRRLAVRPAGRRRLPARARERPSPRRLTSSRVVADHRSRRPVVRLTSR